MVCFGADFFWKWWMDKLQSADVEMNLLLLTVITVKYTVLGQYSLEIDFYPNVGFCMCRRSDFAVKDNICTCTTYDDVHTYKLFSLSLFC